MMEQAKILEVRHLAKRFPAGGLFRPRRLYALQDVSFSVERGQVVALVGESGSGKSTTARLIARLMPPTSGEILTSGSLLGAHMRSPMPWTLAAILLVIGTTRLEKNG